MGFKKRAGSKEERTFFKSSIKKMFFERESRPRAKENIINPKLKGI